MSKARRIIKEHGLLYIQCAALFFTILGARSWIIARFGSDVPYWDQWDGEADNLYKPFYEGTLTLKHLITAHNEHRILFTRLLALGLLVANGQWDPRLQALTNAIIYSLVACGLFLLLAKGQGYRFTLSWCITLAVVFSVPFGWENTLAGFQSQFYFLTAFSLVVIWTLVNSIAFSRWWIVGILCGFAALFTMASGLMAAIASLGVLCLIVLRNRARWRQQTRELLPAAVACVVILAVGSLLAVKVPAHEYLRAHTLRELVRVFVLCLAWPRWHFLWSLPNWLAFGCLVGGYLAGRLSDGRRERFILGMGIWIMAQELAIAYSRAPGAYNVSRYEDVMSFGLLVNFLAGWVLWKHVRMPLARKLFLLLSIIWLATNLLGINRRSFREPGMAQRGYFYSVQVNNTEAYVATGNFQFLEPKLDKQEVPYPDPKRLESLLKDPTIRALLPVSIREPLHLVPSRGNPVLITEQADSFPGPWRRFWEFAAAPASTSDTRLECIVEKKRGLPYLDFFVKDGVRDLAIVDAQQRKYPVATLAINNTGPWQSVYASCPNPVCRITGTGAAGAVLFSEPKEMGRLSLWALIIVNKAHYSFIAAGILFGCSLIILLSSQGTLEATAARRVTTKTQRHKEDRIH